MTLFGTAGIRGDVSEAVDPELALAVGRAVAHHAGAASETPRPTVVLGIDGRTTGEGLAAATTAGLLSGGASVRRVGRVPTPALAYASQDAWGVMLTASHNPPGDNGIKCFVDGVEFDAAAEADVEAIVQRDPDPVGWDRWGSVDEEAILEAYRADVEAYVAASLADGVDALAGQRVAVDCGSGTAGLGTPQVLRAFEATPVALNANVDGAFPARESKPTAETLTTLRRVVADDPEIAIGFGHDGDGDRLVVVGPDGDVVHEDTVLAVLAEHYVRESGADDPVVVTTPNASARIDERVAAAGARTERVALGALHEGIARERAAGGPDTEVVFAAEPWKHVHPAFGGWIDAIVSAAMIAALSAEAGGIDALTESVVERPYRKESVPCPEGAKSGAMERIEAELPDAFDDAAVDTEYGVRLTFDDGGWVLVRPSGTEPYVRIYAEDEDVEAVVETARTVVEDAIEN